MNMKNFFKNFIHIIFLFIIYLCVGSPISAQTKEVDFTELEKTINEELAATKTPGASVAVISGDKIIFAKGFGTTERGKWKSGNCGHAFPNGFDDENVHRRRARRSGKRRKNQARCADRQLYKKFSFEDFCTDRASTSQSIFGFERFRAAWRRATTMRFWDRIFACGKTIYFLPNRTKFIRIRARITGSPDF